MDLQAHKGWVIPASVGVISFGAGVAFGYLLNQRKYAGYLRVSSEDFEEFKSDQVQIDFKRAELDQEFNSNIQQASRVVREFKELGREILERREGEAEKNYSNPRDVEEDDVISIQVMEDGSKMVSVVMENDGWDYEEELKHRTPDKPYIIHRDEYFENEGDYSQTTITFYAGDHVLTDELDVPIYNPETVVGELEFGKGSHDQNICYVRNDMLRAEYEVLLELGTFQAEILGIEEDNVKNDIKHTVRRLNMKLE